MKEQQYQQYAIVQAHTAEQLTDKLNEKLRELSSKDPVVEFDGLTARIQYTEQLVMPESVGEEYHLKGVHLHCSDCPFFEPTMKGDGTVDGRTKKGKCPCSAYGSTWSDSSACDRLFEMINEGGVKLCLGE